MNDKRMNGSIYITIYIRGGMDGLNGEELLPLTVPLNNLQSQIARSFSRARNPKFSLITFTTLIRCVTEKPHCNFWIHATVSYPVCTVSRRIQRQKGKNINVRVL